MAHYAFVNSDNVVVEVIVGRDEDEVVDGISDWEAYYSAQREGLRAIRTSYNTYGGVHYVNNKPSADQSKAFRFNYAGVGFTFDDSIGDDGAFIPPKRFDSWLLDEQTCLWVAPQECPDDGKEYFWNESAGQWVEVV